MFERNQERRMGSAATLLELIYVNTVRSIRKTHGNAFVGLLVAISQTIIMVGIFYVMFTILGLRGAAIRGDFLLYIMSGVFLYFTHVKSVGAVVGSEGPASPMMKHLPMNTAIAICSAALGALYIQTLSMVVVLYFYHVIFSPIEIMNPIGAYAMVLLSWFSGVAIGLVFLALKPWAPGAVGILTTLYTRANMIASGKMFVANSLPGYMLSLFNWNPLFHTIDQARGFAFINYNPHFTSYAYAIYFSLAFLLIGLMGEFYTRRHASMSWSARR